MNLIPAQLVYLLSLVKICTWTLKCLNSHMLYIYRVVYIADTYVNHTYIYKCLRIIYIHIYRVYRKYTLRKS